MLCQGDVKLEQYASWQDPLIHFLIYLTACYHQFSAMSAQLSELPPKAVHQNLVQGDSFGCSPSTDSAIRSGRENPISYSQTAIMNAEER